MWKWLIRDRWHLQRSKPRYWGLVHYGTSEHRHLLAVITPSDYRRWPLIKWWYGWFVILADILRRKTVSPTDHCVWARLDGVVKFVSARITSFVSSLCCARNPHRKSTTERFVSVEVLWLAVLLFVDAELFVRCNWMQFVLVTTYAFIGSLLMPLCWIVSFHYLTISMSSFMNPFICNMLTL